MTVLNMWTKQQKEHNGQIQEELDSCIFFSKQILGELMLSNSQNASSNQIRKENINHQIMKSHQQ